MYINHNALAKLSINAASMAQRLSLALSQTHWWKFQKNTAQGTFPKLLTQELKATKQELHHSHEAKWKNQIKPKTKTLETVKDEKP